MKPYSWLEQDHLLRPAAQMHCHDRQSLSESKTKSRSPVAVDAVGGRPLKTNPTPSLRDPMERAISPPATPPGPGAQAAMGRIADPWIAPAMASDLGFEGPTANSIDATRGTATSCLEFAQALSVMAVHLSRWAEEMILFSSQEYGFISLPELIPGGSSAMPQKKNPDLLELMRGRPDG